MKPGGCDITQKMIDEWNESIKGLSIEEHGAGEFGTAAPVRAYKKLTPGQVLHTIKRVVRGKYKKGRSLI